MQDARKPSHGAMLVTLFCFFIPVVADAGLPGHVCATISSQEDSVLRDRLLDNSAIPVLRCMSI